MRPCKQLQLVAVLAVCGALGACARFEVRLDHFMSADRGTRTARLPLGYVLENHVLTVRGESIGITYAHRVGSRAVILYFGGSAFHRTLEGAIPLQALTLNADVALFDYPGYGDSSGSPGTASILDTATAAYDHVFGLDAAAGKARVLYGFSLGGMVAAHLAQDRRADAIVLEATAPTVAEWARTRIPLALRPFVRLRIEPQLAGLDSATALDQFRGRLLLLASNSDELAPVGLSHATLHRLQRAQRNVELVEFRGCAHGAIMHSPDFAPAMQRLLANLEDGS